MFVLKSLCGAYIKKPPSDTMLPEDAGTVKNVDNLGAAISVRR